MGRPTHRTTCPPFIPAAADPTRSDRSVGVPSRSGPLPVGRPVHAPVRCTTSGVVDFGTTILLCNPTPGGSANAERPRHPVVLPVSDCNSVTVHDYLIDHVDIDWAIVLRPWHWLLPEEFTVWLVNCFGDLFLVFDDGTVHMFDVGGGRVTQIARDRDDFLNLIDEGDNANQWLMIPLIDRLVAADVVLKPGYCYGYRQPPVLGGDYTVENTVVIPIAEHYSFHATIHEQIKDLPDGSQVTIKFNGD